MRTDLWSNTDLVIFDVDGTLYDQRRLRLRMARELLGHTLLSRDLKTLKLLREFRHCRERLGEDSPEDFVDRQFEQTAKSCGCGEADVRKAVEEWIEFRPLRHLPNYRFSDVHTVFDALRQAGKTIAVFSDYPAREKLKALGLEADHVVSATDPDVLRLKPDPAGLVKILEATGMKAGRSLMIGDRFDRDWAAANRIGMPSMVLSRKTDSRGATFRSYSDSVFQPLLREQGAPAARDGELKNGVNIRQDINVAKF